MIVNAGNANVFSGDGGDAAVEAEARGGGRGTGLRAAEEVFVASTGVIGERLPVEQIAGRVPDLVAGLRADGIAAAARAIMTTDTFPKGAVATAEIDGVPVTIAGIAKGSGMIAPDMATMLAFVVHRRGGAAPACCRRCSAAGADQLVQLRSPSTATPRPRDTLLLFATGEAGHAPIADADDPRLPASSAALTEVLHRPGAAGGARRRGRAEVHRRHGRRRRRPTTSARRDRAGDRQLAAGQDRDRRRATPTGAGSHGGRQVGRAGRPWRLGVCLRRPSRSHGTAVRSLDLDEAPVAAHLRGREIDILVSVGGGRGRATVWTCDLTHGYIDINADYRS